MLNLFIYDLIVYLLNDRMHRERITTTVFKITNP
jgi:hypothetical protein